VSANRPSSSSASIRRRLESRVDALPVLPHVLTRLMALDRSREEFPDQVLSLFETSPSLAARIVSVANSAENAPRAPIVNLRMAMTRIGCTKAVNLVTALGLSLVFIPRDAWEKSLWRHAIQTAIAARLLAMHSRDPELPPDEIYLAGLLHDIGRFVILREDPSLLQTIGEGRWDSPDALTNVEREVCGMTHCEIGAIACRHWGFPEALTSVVRDHHTKMPPRASKTTKSIELIRFADLVMFPSALVYTGGLAEADEAALEQAYVPLLPRNLRLTASQLFRLVQTAVADAEVLSGALGLGAPTVARA
jgi:putative nucleotidyltransferase with HDIG domain